MVVAAVVTASAGVRTASTFLFQELGQWKMIFDCTGLQVGQLYRLCVDKDGVAFSQARLSSTIIGVQVFASTKGHACVDHPLSSQLAGES